MMEIIRSSTSEIIFLVDMIKASINEQDFILIIDLTKSPQKKYLAQISNLVQQQNNEIKGTAVILGEVNNEENALLPCKFPISTQSQIVQPPQGLVSKIISYRGEQGIYLGDVITSDKNKEPFLISPDFLERHVLCVASTGAGKSYTVGVLLEEILMKFESAAVLLFDIHNEYWGLIQPNDGPEVEQLQFEDYFPRGFRENVILFEEGAIGLGKHFDLPKLRRIIELTAAQENSLLNLIKEPILLEELIGLIQDSSIHSSTRENLISKIYSLINLKMFEEPLDLHSLIQPGQISIIRLDQYTDERKRNLLVNEILAQIFEKKIQGKIAREQEIVIIVEEAHRFATSTEILPQIAREGRKFGIYEILISQRPGDLPDNIIANMNTLIALRIRSDKDINKIRLMEGISMDTVSVLPHLIRGEALIVGLQGGAYRPIKIHIRPRLSKHVDPQEDIMPENINRFGHILRDKTEIIDTSKMETEEFQETIQNDIGIPSLTIEPFTFKDLTNLLSCQHILILHKTSGICLYGIGVTMFKIDPQLISGFLSAISGLFSELKTQNIVKERTILRMFTEEIGDRAFEIISVEGSYSVTAVILDRTPKYLNDLKKRLRTFVYAFEKEFYTYLKGFAGILDEFASTKHLLDKYLGIALTTPIQINRDYSKEYISSYRDLYEIINDQVNQLADTEGLFVEEIVNQCILDSDYNYREITEGLITLLKEKVLILVDQKRDLPIFSPLSEVQVETQANQEQHAQFEEDSIQTTTSMVDFTDNDQVIAKEIIEIDTEWFQEILGELSVSSLPDSLKEDILTRDLMFESEYRVKSNSIRTEKFSTSDLIRWAQIMTKKGFILEKKSKNPLNGLKLALKADTIIIYCSFALLKDGDYITILGEVG